MTNLENPKSQPSVQEVERARFLHAILESSDPAGELRQLRQEGVIERVCPELARTWGPGSEQDAEWHPEGSVWDHILLVADRVKSSPSPAVRLAAVFHDIAKPLTRMIDPRMNRIVNPDHAELGYTLFREEIGPALGLNQYLTDRTAHLIQYHMKMHHAHNREEVSDHVLCDLAQLPDFPDLLALNEADLTGTGVPGAVSNNDAILERLRDLKHQRHTN